MIKIIQTVFDTSTTENCSLSLSYDVRSYFLNNYLIWRFVPNCLGIVNQLTCSLRSGNPWFRKNSQVNEPGSFVWGLNLALGHLPLTWVSCHVFYNYIHGIHNFILAASSWDHESHHFYNIVYYKLYSLRCVKYKHIHHWQIVHYNDVKTIWNIVGLNINWMQLQGIGSLYINFSALHKTCITPYNINTY